MNIVELNPADPLIYQFRKTIICDVFNENEKYLLKDIKYNHLMNEEVWKFSKFKWESINFKSIFCLLHDEKVVAISGVKFYNNFIRVGMNYYILPEYKFLARSILWKKNGLLFNILKKNPNISGYFISIYPHNNKLKSWVNALNKKKSFGQIGNIDAYYYLKRLNITNDSILFNGVHQYIVYEIFDNTPINTLKKILEQNYD